ncbi:MAG: peptidase P60 [Hoeflea sp.]|nr:peptidase P60 [Hoeflea sp.]|tara:strand:+ start:850 stop:1299 length:450 start_codon:yes stop_codon:yes gene_type:complete
MTKTIDVARGDQIVAAARRWIGTPYRHQASRIRVGADCLGLVRGVFEEVMGRAPERPEPYAADWAEYCGEERLLDAARAHCGDPLDFPEAIPGDILVFRWRDHSSAKHAGILSAPRRFIHAYEQAGVIESPLTPGWARRVVGVFRFPEE